MRTQRRVLQLFAAKAREGRLVSFLDVAREFDITDQAAVACLTRLWQQQLIAPLLARPRGVKWRPAPGERVGALRFRLKPRGEERLKWWAEQGRKKGGDR